MTNSIALAREQEIFAILEDTAGTLKKPVATSYVIGTSRPDTKQQPSFSNSKEINDSRDVIARFQDRFGAGDFKLSMYPRPSGSAGTAPMASDVWEAFYGTKTVNGGTSVVYSQANERKTLSVWAKKDHTLFWCRGVKLEKLEMELLTEGAVEAIFSGRFFELGWLGTDDVAATEPLAETTILVTDAKKYIISGTTQCLVEFELSDGTVYDNSSSGYAVTAVDYGANTITINPGLEAEVASGSIVRGFLPTGTVSGAPIEARNCVANLASSNVPVSKFEYEINDPANILEKEITTTDFPESAVDSTREITGMLGLYWRRDDLAYYYDGRDGNEKDLKMVCGETAGSILTINTPQTVLEIPEDTDEDDTLMLEIPFAAIGSSGNDSCTATFT